MKKLALSLVIAFVAFGNAAIAQDFEKPRTGAKLEITETALNIVPGGEIEFDVWINRSKRAKRSKIGAPTFSGPDAITFEVAQDEANRDHYVVTAKATAQATGKMMFIMNSKTTSYHQIAGKMLSFQVKDSKKLVSKEND